MTDPTAPAIETPVSAVRFDSRAAQWPREVHRWKLGDPAKDANSWGYVISINMDRPQRVYHGNWIVRYRDGTVHVLTEEDYQALRASLSAAVEEEIVAPYLLLSPGDLQMWSRTYLTPTATSPDGMDVAALLTLDDDQLAHLMLGRQQLRFGDHAGRVLRFDRPGSDAKDDRLRLVAHLTPLYPSTPSEAERGN